jgi:hypothetical protein
MHREPGACVTRPSLVGHGARVARREARAQLCETSLQAVRAVFFSFGVVKATTVARCTVFCRKGDTFDHAKAFLEL